MADNRIRLIAEVDATQAQNAATQTGNKWVSTTQRIDSAVKGTSQHLARAATAMSGAIGAVTAGVAAQERSWLALGTAVLGSFAAGGPIGGGIALLGAGIGILSSRENEAEIATKAFKFELDSLRQAADAAEKQLKDASGVSEFGEKLEFAEGMIASVERRLARLRTPEGFANPRDLGEINKLEQLRFEYEQLRDEAERGFGAEGNLHDLRLSKIREALDLESKQRERIAEARTEYQLWSAEIDNVVAKLEKQLGLSSGQGRRDETIQRFVAALRGEGTARQDIRAQEFIRDVERQNLLLRERDPIKRAELAIDQDIARARRELLDAEFGISDERRKQLEDALQENAGARKRELLPVSEAERFTRTLGPQLADTLADGLVTGIREGKDKAGRVFTDFLGNIGSQLASLGTNALLFQLLGGIGGGALFPQGIRFFAHGGSFVTQGGGLFVAGEGANREQVSERDGITTVEPVKAAKVSGGGVSFGGVNITVTGADASDPNAFAERLLEGLAVVARSSKGRRLFGG